MNTTPVPLLLAVPETKPRMLVVLLLGRKAVYVTPVGLFSVIGASPSLPVVPGTMGPTIEPPMLWERTTVRVVRVVRRTLNNIVLICGL